MENKLESISITIYFLPSDVDVSSKHASQGQCNIFMTDNCDDFKDFLRSYKKIKTFQGNLNIK